MTKTPDALEGEATRTRTGLPRKVKTFPSIGTERPIQRLTVVRILRRPDVIASCEAMDHVGGQSSVPPNGGSACAGAGRLPPLSAIAIIVHALVVPARSPPRASQTSMVQMSRFNAVYRARVCVGTLTSARMDWIFQSGPFLRSLKDQMRGSVRGS